MCVLQYAHLKTLMLYIGTRKRRHINKMENPIYCHACAEICAWNTCSVLLFVLLFFSIYDYIETDLNNQDNSQHLSLHPFGLLRIVFAALLYCICAVLTAKRLLKLSDRIEKRHVYKEKRPSIQRRRARRRMHSVEFA